MPAALSPQDSRAVLVHWKAVLHLQAIVHQAWRPLPQPSKDLHSHLHLHAAPARSASKPAPAAAKPPITVRAECAVQSSAGGGRGCGAVLGGPSDSRNFPGPAAGPSLPAPHSTPPAATAARASSAAPTNSSRWCTLPSGGLGVGWVWELGLGWAFLQRNAGRSQAVSCSQTAACVLACPPPCRACTDSNRVCNCDGGCCPMDLSRCVLPCLSNSAQAAGALRAGGA